MVRERGKSSSHKKWKNVDHAVSSKSLIMKGNYPIELKAVVDASRLILKQGWAFGWRDEFARSTNRGNFIGLLNMLCEISEDVKNAFQSDDLENHPLTSLTTQKEIIEACTAETRKVILNEVGDKFFSLLLAGTQDCDVIEYMAVVLRFVNDSGEVMERFLGVVHFSERSTVCYKNAIDIFFAKIGLSLSRLRGVSYDGVCGMRNVLNEVKNLILDENKHAHYVHCFTQQVESVVVAVAEVEAYMFVQSLSKIVNIIGVSCKIATCRPSDALEQLQHDERVKKIQMGEISKESDQNQEMTSTQSGVTHWGSYYETIIHLFDMWDPVVDVIDAIEEFGTDVRNRIDAKNLLDEMFTFEYVFVAKLMMKILGITSPLSLILQANDRKTEDVIEIIKVVKMNLLVYREHGWEELLKEATEFCSAQEIPIPVPDMQDLLPRGAMRRIHGESKTNLFYFRVYIFTKVIDYIAQELDDRFTESNSELLICIMCLDPSNSFANYDYEWILNLAKFYPEDFSNSELTELGQQLEIYISHVRSDKAFFDLHDIGALAKKMVEKQYHIRFHIVYKLIGLVLVLPIVDATEDRSFTTMTKLETELRDEMGDDFSLDCMMCYIERKFFVSVEDEALLQHFQNMRSQE